MMHFIRDLTLQYADESQDNESSWRGSTLFNKPDYKSFKFIDNTSGGRRLREIKGANAFESEKQKNEERMRWKNVPVKAVGSSERRKIYIKKNVVDSFLPEIVGFLGKNNYHFIKDSYGNIEAHPIDCCKLDCCEINSLKKCSILASDEESDTSSPELESAHQNPVVAEESDSRKAIVLEYSENSNEDKESPGQVEIQDINEEDSDDYQPKEEDSNPSEIQARLTELVANSDPEYVYELNKETFDDPVQYRESWSSGSSTSTSASFAFPILISEWPGTPRRMPRADRRYWRDHHHYWRKNLLCCRF